MTNPNTNFDPYDYGFQEDPYPMYTQLRVETPLGYSPERDVWVLSRHADVFEALRDNGSTFSNANGVSIDATAWGPQASKTMSFLAMDAPDHMRLRRLVSKGFTPRRVSAMEPDIRALSARYLDRMLDGASSGDVVNAEFIADFAGLLPMDVISEMVGVPESDRQELRRLADLVMHREPGVFDVPQEGMEAALELIMYYIDMVKQREKNPTEDLTTALIQADLDGDALTQDEIVGFLFLMVVAGNETTTKLLGNMFYHITNHPEQQREVFADATGALVPQWVEETLRFDTSSQMVARHLKQDLTLHGVTAPADSKIILALGSANRDDTVFGAPTTYNIHRDEEELSQILSFGSGQHFCLGANLARLEARVALEEILKRVSDIAVDHDAAVRVRSVNVRGFASLPTKFTLR